MLRSAWVLCVMFAGCQRTAEEVAATRGSGSGSAVTPSTAGHERADCRPDKTCDPGLLCLSDLCVRPPPADCNAVAETLASLELGNYAPREQRAPLVAAKRTACETAKVSKDEAKCIDTAHDKYAIAACVPRMFPEIEPRGSGGGQCDEIAEHMRAMIARASNDPRMTQMIDSATSAVRASCNEDGWPDSVKQCLASASTDDAMKACEPLMPPYVTQKLQERMRRPPPTTP